MSLLSQIWIDEEWICLLGQIRKALNLALFQGNVMVSEISVQFPLIYIQE